MLSRKTARCPTGLKRKGDKEIMMNNTEFLFEKEVLGETDVNSPQDGDKADNATNGEVNAGEVQKDKQAPATTEKDTKEEINIDEIVNKALEKKEKAMLKSIFKQQGVPEDQIDAKIAEYKEQLEGKKEDKLAAKEAELKILQDNLERSKNIILNREILTATIAAGVDPAKAELFTKLIDRSGLKVGDDFSVNSEAINKAISSVLEKVPEFKRVQETSGLKFGTQKQVTNQDNKKTYSLRDGIESKY